MANQVDFEPLGRRVTVPDGSLVMEAARQGGVALSFDCGGHGTCGRCRVRVMHGQVSPPTDAESRRLGDDLLRQGWRLACQTRVQGNVKLYVPLESLRGAQRLQLGGLQPTVEVEPLLRAAVVSLSPPTLDDLRADTTRLLQELSRTIGTDELCLDLAVGRSLPIGLRNGLWRATVWLKGREVIGIAPVGHVPLGMAVDLGTTKIAAYLVDLASGETLAVTGAMNPQIAYGEDLMSRIGYANGGRARAAELSQVVVDALNELLEELCARVGRSPGDVLDLVVVGNTAMHHLFLQLPVEQLGSAPYVPALSHAWDVKARELGLKVAPGAYVHLLPNVAGFVGADHVAMILGAEIYKAKGTVIGVDIGTNTEIVLAHRGKMVSCSCASGPAFEGAHIRDGMRAASGAIERVVWSGDHFRIVTIDDAPPIGICGSGVLDAVAALYRAGIINNRGRFQVGHPLVTGSGPEAAVTLASAEVSGHGRPVQFTQRDVGEVQLAKGAIRAGMECLLRYMGVSHEEIEEVVIAGAFGTYVDVESALTIGLFPALPIGRFRQVGNAAGVGAKLALISRSQRALAAKLGEEIEYIELMAQPDFPMVFAESMLFPELSGQRSVVEGV